MSAHWFLTFQGFVVIVSASCWITECFEERPRRGEIGWRRRRGGRRSVRRRRLRRLNSRSTNCLQTLNTHETLLRLIARVTHPVTSCQSQQSKRAYIFFLFIQNTTSVPQLREHFTVFPRLTLLKHGSEWNFHWKNLVTYSNWLILFVFILTKNVRYTSNVKTIIFAHPAFLPAETLFLKLITHAAYRMKGY